MAQSILLNIITYTGFIIFIGHNFFKKLDKNLNQWEKANKLNFTQFQNDEMLYNIKEVLNHNEKFYGTLEKLKKTLFFKIFKLNLEPECTLFQQEQICKNEACQICECDENEVPKIWEQETHRGEFLNIKIEDPFNKWIDKYTINTKQWLLEEDIDSKDGTYINLLKNPEGYTGYRGAHIWNAIFKENCLSDRFNFLCKEDRTFFRIFSGWLSNTNFEIGMNFHDIVKNTTFINVTMLTERLLNEKDRVDNFFFLYSLVIKAINKAKDFLLEYNYQSGNKSEDENTINLINSIFKDCVNDLQYLEDAFNETTPELDNFMNSQKISELIIRFRNISSIIDCVTCSKCRMHAKLEVFGIGTTLKILFANNFELKESISRNELVSFINLFAKLSKNVQNIKLIDEGINKAHYYLKFKYGGIVLFCFIFWIYAVFFDKGKEEEKKVENKNEKKEENKIENTINGNEKNNLSNGINNINGKKKIKKE